MANFIGMFNTSCPSGWTNFSALNGKYPKISASYGGSGSAIAHTHSATLPNSILTSSSNTQTRKRFVGPSANSIKSGHTHSVTFASVNTNSKTLEPKHTTLVFCYVTE